MLIQYYVETTIYCCKTFSFQVEVMSKLDDLLGKKKEVVQVLDLSRTIATTKEEYKRLLERVPDFKMRPIKVG